MVYKRSFERRVTAACRRRRAQRRRSHTAAMCLVISKCDWLKPELERPYESTRTFALCPSGNRLGIYCRLRLAGARTAPRWDLPEDGAARAVLDGQERRDRAGSKRCTGVDFEGCTRIGLDPVRLRNGGERQQRLHVPGRP